MSADEVVQTADRPHAVRTPLAAVPYTQDGRFWFGLAFAAALHAALIFGVTRSSPRQMGERTGRPDGISVVLVDAADLASRNTFRKDGSSGGPKTTARPPAPAPAPKREASANPEAKPAPPAESTTPSPHAPGTLKDTPAIKKEALEAVPLPELPPGQQKTLPKLQQKPPLQLTIPDIRVAPGGRGAAVTRPPGVTRSGENDNFWRGVIRALRQTMPSPNGQLGRVSVRLLLSNNGNLVDVQLIRSAGVPGLDQSVVFAVKQASFPIPPAGSTLVDRTFLITYIYN